MMDVIIFLFFIVRRRIFMGFLGVRNSCERLTHRLHLKKDFGKLLASLCIDLFVNIVAVIRHEFAHLALNDILETWALPHQVRRTLDHLLENASGDDHLLFGIRSMFFNFVEIRLNGGNRLRRLRSDNVLSLLSFGQKIDGGGIETSVVSVHGSVEYSVKNRFAFCVKNQFYLA
jgi:hypothetical protein